MSPKSWIILIVIIVAAASITYFSQMRYKYSCVDDEQCYPCTRWFSCVSEEFYMKNTQRCRIGAEENFSRIICGCGEGMCRATEIRPMNHTNQDAWSPPDD